MIIISATKVLNRLQRYHLFSSILIILSFSCVVQSLCNHPSLISLWMGNNRLTDNAAKHVAVMISKNSVIKEINLSNKWPPVTKGQLELDSHPRITFLGAQYIADVLKNTKDKTLNLADGSGQLVSTNMKGNHNTLVRLSLAEQRVGSAGAIALFQALEHCHIKHLNLYGLIRVDSFLSPVIFLIL